MPEKGFLGLVVNHPLRKACILAMHTTLFNTVVLTTIGTNCLFLASESNNPKYPYTPWGTASRRAECALSLICLTHSLYKWSHEGPHACPFPTRERKP